MKKTPIPFLLLAALALAALFLKGSSAAPEANGEVNAGDTAWMLTASALVLLMTPGLSFFYGGMVRYKNVVSTMLQSVIALGIISLLWVVVGFSLAFGDSIGGIIGNPLTFFMFQNVGDATAKLGSTGGLALSVPLLVFAMFQLKFAIITPALITGSFAERVRFSAYLLFMCLFSLVIYCPLAHMTWHPDGLFFQWGVKDFAGGTVVHMSAGLAALAGAIVLGQRTSHRKQEAHPPANIPYVLLGTGMLWFGWFGFNAGSAVAASGLAASAFATTNTASAAAMLGWIFFDWMRGVKPSALGACIGAVVGLVAITPAAGFVTVPHSIFIGLVAGVISNLAVQLRTKSKLDDTLDVFPCHGVGGMVGMIMTGIFAVEGTNADGTPKGDAGLFYGQFAQFIGQCKALVIVAVFSFVASLILYKLVDLIIPLRVTEEEEELGLDLTQHGEKAVSLGSLLANGNGHAHGNGQAAASAAEQPVPVSH
ncbi:MAG: ammonia channel protein [Isosphaeraceae bacterium]|nr:MAG: ammonia channel protein [Isosphaeraceae bacterium]